MEQEIVGVANKAGVVPTQLMTNPNKTSGGVVPLHAIDSAILLISYMRTYKHFRDAGQFKGLNSLAIHDAIKSNPKMLIEFQKHYHEATLDVGLHYDIISEMKIELQYTIDKIKELGGDVSTESTLNKSLEVLGYNEGLRLDYKKNKIEELRNNPNFHIFGSKVREADFPTKPIDVTNYGHYTEREFGILSSYDKRMQDKAYELSKAQKDQNKPKFTPKVKVAHPSKRFEKSEEHYQDLKSLVSSGKPFVVLSTRTSNDRQIGNKEVRRV